MTVRWVGWVPMANVVRAEARFASFGSSTSVPDRVQANPGAYGTKAHAVPAGVGGTDGVAGKAACGALVPADDRHRQIPYAWTDDGEVARCKRCVRKIAAAVERDRAKRGY